MKAAMLAALPDHEPGLTQDELREGECRGRVGIMYRRLNVGRAAARG